MKLRPTTSRYPYLVEGRSQSTMPTYTKDPKLAKSLEFTFIMDNYNAIFSVTLSGNAQIFEAWGKELPRKDYVTHDQAGKRLHLSSGATLVDEGEITTIKAGMLYKLPGSHRIYLAYEDSNEQGYEFGTFSAQQIATVAGDGVDQKSCSVKMVR